MNDLNNFISSLKYKNIHIVGATGAEGSGILSFLSSSGITSITLHDFINRDDLEKNFKLWHKGLSVETRNSKYSKFLNNIRNLKFNFRNSYLKNIENADIIFVPQSWRLYKKNGKLFSIEKKGTPFYSLTRLYLDLAPSKIIAVTGTVGKGSVANLIYQILKMNNKSVFFAGNETWRLQLADQLPKMKSSDILVLEISHRQLIDGFNRAPDMAVITNLYPNHLDEMSFENYCLIKLSLVKKQNSKQISILNYDNEILRKAAGGLKSKVIYFSSKNPNKNIQAVRNIFSNLKNLKSSHYIENILAAGTAVLSLGIAPGDLPDIFSQIPPLPARLEKIGEIQGVSIYDDIKSTSPWATLKAVESFSKDIILITGGDMKGIAYGKLAERIINQKIITIVLKSQLSQHLKKHFPDMNIIVKDDLNNAVVEGLRLAGQKGNLLISPAAANFYSYFIKGKISIRKIIASLS